MKIQDAKRLPLAEVLAQLGHQPVKQVRGELWYRSPFRPETTPSFKVNLARNIWYDFGEGVGGNVLDLVMRHDQLTSLAAAIRRLAALDQHGPPPRAPITPNPVEPERAEPDARPEAIVRPLQHPALTTYLSGRGIPVALARQYLEEIHYTRDGKAYFALAFRNNRGGYELRNPYFKGTHGPKAITLLPGAAGSLTTLAVFEGVLDVLSAHVTGWLAPPVPAVLVLNSTALKDRALAAIRESGASRVELYLDHDPSGRELTACFARQLSGIEVVDRAERYAGHKDVNAWLTGPRRTTTRPSG